MRILVCGGRQFADWPAMQRTLDMLLDAIDIHCVIHGNCVGADRMAGKWAQLRFLPCDVYPIAHGEDGFERNERMLKASLPDLIVAYPGGNGTKHMTRIAHEAGKTVVWPLAPEKDDRQLDMFEEI